MVKGLVFFGALALAAAQPLAAQDATAQIKAQAAQLRALAKQMEGQLPAQDIADMLTQADEIEKGANEGAFNAGPLAEDNDPVSRLTREHGRVEWLSKYSVCTGFRDNDYRTFKMTVGDRLAERNAMCREIYGHYTRYFEASKNGNGGPAADAELEAYDRGAKAAIAFYGER